MSDSSWGAAFLFGALAAASLPLGALIGAWLRPTARVIASIMAFGAGVLLSAVAFELVLPGIEREHFGVLTFGLLLGCMLFVLLNHVLNERGAFLRKAATLGKYARRFRQKKVEHTLDELAKADILRSLPPEEAQSLIPYVIHENYPAGEVLINQGEAGDALFIIESGKVAVMREKKGRTTTLANLSQGETFGEATLLTQEPRNASVIALEPVSVWKIEKDDFERLIKNSPALKKAVTEIMEDRNHRTSLLLQAEEWRDRAYHNLTPEVRQPTSQDVNNVVQKARQRGTVGFAIWLGSILDGIGESVVLGASTVAATVSFPLLGAVFLANLPESMSSAVTLRRQNVDRVVIVMMWASLVIFAGVCAVAGHLLLLDSPAGGFSFIEALAAGTILAMIAQTMLPEAFEEGGGNLVAILTVTGFLAGILLVAFT